MARARFHCFHQECDRMTTDDRAERHARITREHADVLERQQYARDVRLAA